MIWSWSLFFVALLSQEASAPRVDVSAIPAPMLDHFEPAVREQLENSRQRAEVAATAETAIATLELGRLCQSYLHYALYSPAEACLGQMTRLQPDDFRWPYYLGVLHSLEGRSADATHHLELAKRLRADYAPTWIRLADLALEEGKTNEAKKAYEGALALAPDSPVVHFGLARLAAERGELRKAIAGYQKTLSSQPEGSVAHYHLGMAYRTLGDLEQARRELEQNQQVEVTMVDPLIQALDALDVSRETAFNRALESRRLGRRVEAIEAFRELLERFPEDAEAHYNLAGALVDEGELTEGEHHLREAMRIRPGFRDAHFNLAVLLGRRGEPDTALEQLDLVATIDPKFLPARILKARLHAQKGEPERAIRELQQVLEVDPAHVEAHYYLAMVQLAVEDSSPAIAHLRAAVELDPDWLPPRIALAQELARRGQYSESARQFGVWVAHQPAEPRAHLGSGMALLLDRRDGEARQAFETGLEKLPEHPVLLPMLARLLACSTDSAVRDGARAEVLARRAVELQLTLDNVETLAMALAEQGRFDEAARLQTTVLEREQQTTGTVATERRERLESYRKHEAVRAPWLAQLD